MVHRHIFLFCLSNNYLVHDLEYFAGNLLHHYNPYIINGNTNLSQRNSIINTFQEDNNNISLNEYPNPSMFTLGLDINF